jgi:hypothetical protein
MAGSDVILRGVPDDARPNDVRLRDPAAAGGTVDVANFTPTVAWQDVGSEVAFEALYLTPTVAWQDVDGAEVAGGTTDDVLPVQPTIAWQPVAGTVTDEATPLTVTPAWQGIGSEVSDEAQPLSVTPAWQLIDAAAGALAVDVLPVEPTVEWQELDALLVEFVATIVPTVAWQDVSGSIGYSVDTLPVEPTIAWQDVGGDYTGPQVIVQPVEPTVAWQAVGGSSVLEAGPLSPTVAWQAIDEFVEEVGTVTVLSTSPSVTWQGVGSSVGQEAQPLEPEIEWQEPGTLLIEYVAPITPIIAWQAVNDLQGQTTPQAEESSTGGWARAFREEQRRLKKRDEEWKKEQERELAQLLKAKLRAEDDQAQVEAALGVETQRLSELVGRYASTADQSLWGNRTARAIEYAQKSRTEFAYQLALRAIVRQIEEEEIVMLMALAVA